MSTTQRTAVVFSYINIDDDGNHWYRRAETYTDPTLDPKVLQASIGASEFTLDPYGLTFFVYMGAFGHREAWEAMAELMEVLHNA